jgi:Spy/CpxP family protein refolding chaperone
MKASKISLIAAMVLGGLVACSTSVRAADSTDGSKGKGKGGRMSVEQQMEKLTTELSLTDDQKPKVKEVLEASSKKRQELMADSSTAPEDRRTKFREIMTDQEKKMKEILKPDQFEKYKTWVEQNMRGGGGGKKKKSE